MPGQPKKEPPVVAQAPSLLSAGWVVFWAIVGIIPWFVFAYGAAKLSYNKFGSVGWSILDFIFPGFYYPYYAFFLDTSSPTLFGGRRR